MFMRKTMVYLEDDQFIYLKKAAVSSGKRMSQIIREALSSYLRGQTQKADYFSFVGIAEGPEGGDTSEKVEQILRERLK